MRVSQVQVINAETHIKSFDMRSLLIYNTDH